MFLGVNKGKKLFIIYHTATCWDSLQQQTLFNGRILEDKCCCYGDIYIYIYSDVSFIRGSVLPENSPSGQNFEGTVFFLLYFDSITSEIRVPEPDVNVWEPMYRNNRIPASWSGNNLIGDLFSHPEIIHWSTSLSNRRLNLFEKVWYFPKHRTTTGKTLMFLFTCVIGNQLAGIYLYYWPPLWKCHMLITRHYLWLSCVPRLSVFVWIHNKLLELTACKNVRLNLTFKAALQIIIWCKILVHFCAVEWNSNHV